MSTLEALRNAGLWTPQAQDSYEEGFSEEQGFEDDDEAAMVDDDEDDNSQDESLDD
ncbi:hypothetical protein [Enteractinococcus helveticum]|uniref:hypothetical protein n=1 Tax=Enteractinococcus helveticum TaxID=1837282 RepID=UPI001F3827D9|nr:hypothetical protein [Enteractinococcus helveticum]